MSSIPSGSRDSSLNEVVSAAEPSTIADAISIMRTIDALLPENDGLKWFNRMYQLVTEEVNAHPPGGSWQNPAWLERLDVVFAGFYFTAVADHLAGRPTPAAWRALFEARFTPSIDRIQFALAGMNAHINHDLAQALVRTDAEFEIAPAGDGPEHADYESVNVILNNLMPSVLNMLATDALGYIAQDTGKIGRILAYWNICRAREMAWDFGNHLRGLKGMAYDTALAMQDTLTGALGRAILTQL
jgi:uncharacterized protein DUF5995